MSLSGFWLSLELRRRWRALAVLALLIAFASGTVLAAVAGARRGDTAADRLAAATRAATVVMRPFDSDARFWAAVRALPQVEALTTLPAMAFGVDDLPDTRSGLTLPPGDAELFRTIEVPVILDGRLADPGRVDEVVVTSLFRENRGKGVGDRVTLRLMTPEQAAATNRPGGGLRPAGPAIPARIVGVVRSSWFAENPGGGGGVIASPALFARYHANIVGAHSEIPIEGLARLKGGRGAIAAFRADVSRVTGSYVDMEDIDATVTAHRRQVDGYEAAALTFFAAVAAVAAIVLVGQAMARYCGTAIAELRSLGAVGMTPRQQVTAASAGPTLSGIAGVLLGVAGAVAASSWMPIGSAALHEPAPGLDVDAPVLVLGGALVAVLAGAGAAATAAVMRAVGPTTTGRRSAIAQAVAKAGLPLPVVVGARFALEPGRGRTAVAVRPALAGAVAGVLGVLAAFTFSAGVSEAAGNPARFGQTQRLEIYLGFGGDDVTGAAPLVAAIARDSAVAAVNDSRISVVRSRGVTFPVFTYDPVGEPLEAVLFKGRLPAGPGEIALGAETAGQLRMRIGDRVSVPGAETTAMSVTGIGLLPAGLQSGYTQGGWVTPAAFRHLVAGGPFPFMWHIAHVALRPGADPAVVVPRLQKIADAVTAGDPVTVGFPATPPPQITEIRDIAGLPALLGGFLALLSVGATGHVLATAIRRRRHEVAVLRALGMTRPQARLIVVTQATVLATIGLLAGIPLGLALGRTVWRVAAEQTPLQYVPPSAPLALALIVPAALLIACLLAVWPSRAAGRLRIAAVLSAE
ncbi:ABC transporter permease [Microbispora sp. NPDC049125]|uniref:ABC transporter permease n=1 Tax=Microbispora sp. NPDC049125 TaxID=3154929 RepID=UPI003466A213